MQTQTHIEEFLRARDEDYDKYLPALYKASTEDKDKYMIQEIEYKNFYNNAVNRCAIPCFNQMNTSGVNETESTCMTNCVLKSLQNMVIGQKLALKEFRK